MFKNNAPVLEIELDAEYLAELLMKHSTYWEATLAFLDNLAIYRNQLFSADTVANIIRAEYDKE